MLTPSPKYQHAFHVLTNEISNRFYLGPMGKPHSCCRISLNQNSINKTTAKETWDICSNVTCYTTNKSLRLDLNCFIQVFHPYLTSIRSIWFSFKAYDMPWSWEKNGFPYYSFLIEFSNILLFTIRLRNKLASKPS